MNNLKKRVASQKILQFLQNNQVIFFFQKKSAQSDHWRLLKKEIAKVDGVASLNIKNKRDQKEIQPLILSSQSFEKSAILLSNSSNPSTGVESTSRHHSESPSLDQILPSRHSECSLQKEKKEKHSAVANGPQHLESEIRLEMVERVCGLLYAPNLILGSNSIKKLAHLSFQLKEDSNLIFVGGWDGNQVINHLDSFKLVKTPQDIWKEGVSCLSSGYGRPYLFLHSLLSKRGNSLIYSLKEKMRGLTRSLQEREKQQVKKKEKDPK